MSDAARRRDLPPLHDWLDSPTKARLVAFYHQNPGVAETLEGLARRLRIRSDVLADAVRSHVSLGLLREIRTSAASVYLFNRDRQKQLEHLMANAMGRAMWQERGA